MLPSHAVLNWFRKPVQEESWHPHAAQTFADSSSLGLGVFFFPQTLADAAEMSRSLSAVSGVLEATARRREQHNGFPQAARQNQSWLVLDSQIPSCDVSSRRNTVTHNTPFTHKGNIHTAWTLQRLCSAQGFLWRSGQSLRFNASSLSWAAVLHKVMSHSTKVARYIFIGLILRIPACLLSWQDKVV